MSETFVTRDSKVVVEFYSDIDEETYRYTMEITSPTRDSRHLSTWGMSFGTRFEILNSEGEWEKISIATEIHEDFEFRMEPIIKALTADIGLEEFRKVL